MRDIVFKVEYYNENQTLLMNSMVKNDTMYIAIQNVKNGGNLSLRRDATVTLIRKKNKKS